MTIYDTTLIILVSALIVLRVFAVYVNYDRARALEESWYQNQADDGRKDSR